MERLETTGPVFGGGRSSVLTVIFSPTFCSGSVAGLNAAVTVGAAGGWEVRAQQDRTAAEHGRAAKRAPTGNGNLRTARTSHPSRNFTFSGSTLDRARESRVVLSVRSW